MYVNCRRIRGVRWQFQADSCVRWSIFRHGNSRPDVKGLRGTHCMASFHVLMHSVVSCNAIAIIALRVLRFTPFPSPLGFPLFSPFPYLFLPLPPPLPSRSPLFWRREIIFSKYENYSLWLLMIFRIRRWLYTHSLRRLCFVFFSLPLFEHRNLYIAKSLIPLPLSYPLLPFVLAFYLPSPPLRLLPTDTKISDLRLNFDVLQSVSWGPVVSVWALPDSTFRFL